MQRRRYSTALRADQTAMTRRRILDTAGRLFAEQGYLGTTLAAVAKAASVSVQTVYNVVGGKPQLLKAVYDVALAGDDEPVPLAQRPAIQAVIAATSARQGLALYAAIGRQLAERTLPLVMMALAQAGAGDTDLREFAETIEAERAAGTRNLARHVADRFGLRTGLDADTAADVLWVLTAPDIADRLVNRRAWGWDRYQEWLATAMADALTGPIQNAGADTSGSCAEH